MQVLFWGAGAGGVGGAGIAASSVARFTGAVGGAGDGGGSLQDWGRCGALVQLEVPNGLSHLCGLGPRMQSSTCSTLFRVYASVLF